MFYNESPTHFNGVQSPIFAQQSPDTDLTGILVHRQLVDITDVVMSGSTADISGFPARDHSLRASQLEAAGCGCNDPLSCMCWFLAPESSFPSWTNTADKVLEGSDEATLSTAGRGTVD